MYLRMFDPGNENTEKSRKMDFIKRYLAIEKTRIGDRLTIDINIDFSLLNIKVPSLILQPIVENAIRHGVGNNIGRSKIGIYVTQKNENITIQVTDDGYGFDIGEKESGIGLKITRDRLKALFGNNYNFDIRSASEGGTIAEIEMPLKQDMV